MGIEDDHFAAAGLNQAVFLQWAEDFGDAGPADAEHLGQKIVRDVEFGRAQGKYSLKPWGC